MKAESLVIMIAGLSGTTFWSARRPALSRPLTAAADAAAMAFINNPFEGDPDFQYLAIDKKMMLDEQAKPFDAKTSCWIPDHKEGFLACTITATKGEEVTVHTEKSEVWTKDVILFICYLYYFICCCFVCCFSFYLLFIYVISWYSVSSMVKFQTWMHKLLSCVCVLLVECISAVLY